MFTNLKGALASLARVFLTALVAAIVTVWQDPATNHDVTRWGTAGAASFAAAVILTLVNMIRPGETRFGKHAEPQ